MSVQQMEEMGKEFCPNFLPPFLENNDRRSCNDGSPLNIFKAVMRSFRSKVLKFVQRSMAKDELP